MAQAERNFAVFAHGYQPGRRLFKPDGSVLEVVPDENEKIYRESYQPIFVESGPLPDGLIISFYTTIREWVKQAHPEGFNQIRRKVQQMPDKEYAVLGDPYIHAVLPLLPGEDQDMLLQMGRSAFSSDFGFEPKGLWLPETAVSNQTLELASKNGYEFVVLRDHQLWSAEQNPMHIRLANGDEIAIFHFNSQLSSKVSFDKWTTMNADNFLGDWVEGFVPNEVSFLAIGSDMELYGHHRSGAIEWLQYLLKPDTLASHGFTTLSLRRGLSGNHLYTNVVDDSSWSCDHNLGRWKGECDCDGATEEIQRNKKDLFSALSGANRLINQSLDGLDPGWRYEFRRVTCDLKEKIFAGEDFLTDLKEAVSREKFTLFAAKIYAISGLTSCGWYFGKSDSPERKIPETLVVVLQQLLGLEQILKPAA